MSEIDERRIDAVVDSFREVRAGYSPARNRLMHMTNQEVDAALAGFEQEECLERQTKTDCACAPRGFISTPRAVKERMRAEHIAAGVHETFCPMFKARRDYEPYYLGFTHEVIPSHWRTNWQDEDAEVTRE